MLNSFLRFPHFPYYHHPPQKTMHNFQNTLLPFSSPDYPSSGDPLSNLSKIQSRLHSLSQTLSNSVNSNTPLSPHQSSLISSELSTSILHVIINGASLIASSSSSNPPIKSDGSDEKSTKVNDDLEIIELDADTLTADHSHVCEYCGKGFKRDANLRMHMRAHGEKFKTLESLSKPNNNNTPDNDLNNRRKTRFSCPFVGCDRNKKHENFRPLKSGVCVKNHFKRFHCAKMFSCTKCKCKSFSVLADLKRHMKNCSTVITATTTRNKTVIGELCSCGTRFPTMDELFRHVSLSEGHMPATRYHGGDKIYDDDQDMRFWTSIEDITQFF